MTTLNTSADILNWVMFQAGEPLDGTSDFQDHAIESLNRAYREIWTGGGAIVKEMNEPWLWLKKDPPGTLILEPVRNTGTISVTNNNTTATLSASVVADLDGWFLKVEGHPDVFRVQAHTPGSAILTLDSVYTGATNAAATYKLMKLEYELAADLLRVVAPMRVYKDNKPEIDGVSLLSLERDYPLMYVESGVPDCFAMVTETKVRFNRYGGVTSTEFIRAEYDYLQKPATELIDDTNTPLVPLQYRQVLADLTLFYLLISKSDSKAEGVGQMAQAGLQAMAADNRARLAQFSRTMGAIVTRPSTRYSTRGVRVLIGGV